MDSVFGISGDGYASLCSIAAICFRIHFSSDIQIRHARRMNVFTKMYFIFNEFRFVILAADASAARSILVFKHDQDKVSSKISFILSFLFSTFFRF
jgi:hypothetical protein